MIVKRSKNFSVSKEEMKNKREKWEERRKKINSAEAGIAASVPVALTGMALGFRDAEKFDDKNLNRVKNIQDKYYDAYDKKYKNELKAIRDKGDEVINTLKNKYANSGNKLKDIFTEIQILDKVNLAEEKLADDAFNRVSKNIDKVSNRVSKMNNLVNKGYNKRLGRNLTLAGLGAIATGVGAYKLKKNSLDKKKK